MNLDSTIMPILEDYISRVRRNLDLNKINASRRTEQSLRIEQYNNGYRVVIGGPKTAPPETLQEGRPPGRVPYNFEEILYQWMKDKGLRASMKWANALKWKIAHEGTLRWQRYGQNGTYLNIYTDEGKTTEKALHDKINTAITNMIIQRK